MDAEVRSLIIGFVLTTVLGGVFGAWFQRLAWRRQARLEMAKQSYIDSTALYSEATRLIDRRYYGLFRWYLSVRDRSATAVVEARELQYYQTVGVWNESLRILHNRLRMDFGEMRALAFLDYADDFKPEQPESLHYRFVRATQLVRLLFADRADLDEVTSAINELNWALTAFANDAANDLMQRSRSLSALKLASSSDEATPGLISGPQHPGGKHDPPT
ncbi:MAG TPA: hypothetical protein VIT65_17665 [Microlunatus sp.]